MYLHGSGFGPFPCLARPLSKRIWFGANISSSPRRSWRLPAPRWAAHCQCRRAVLPGEAQRHQLLPTNRSLHQPIVGLICTFKVRGRTPTAEGLRDSCGILRDRGPVLGSWVRLAPNPECLPEQMSISRIGRAWATAGVRRSSVGREKTRNPTHDVIENTGFQRSKPGRIPRSDVASQRIRRARIRPGVRGIRPVLSKSTRNLQNRLDTPRAGSSSSIRSAGTQPAGIGRPTLWFGRARQLGRQVERSSPVRSKDPS